jgi:hypothetical protein
MPELKPRDRIVIVAGEGAGLQGLVESFGPSEDDPRAFRARVRMDDGTVAWLNANRLKRVEKTPQTLAGVKSRANCEGTAECKGRP